MAAGIESFAAGSDRCAALRIRGEQIRSVQPDCRGEVTLALIEGEELISIQKNCNRYLENNWRGNSRLGGVSIVSSPLADQIHCTDIDLSIPEYLFHPCTKINFGTRGRRHRAISIGSPAARLASMSLKEYRRSRTDARFV